MAWPRSALPLCFSILTLVAAGSSRASELKPRTVKAFQHYEELTEARIQTELGNPEQFLFLDTLPEEQRKEQIARIKNGQVYIQQLSTRDNDKKIEIPDGLVHHWLAVGFIPKAHLDQVIGVQEDFNHHADFFKPDVQRSKLLSQDGQHYHVYLRLYRKTIVTAVYNTEFDADFTRRDPTHEVVVAKAVRIAEVQHAGQEDEREEPVGHDHGYLWRLDLYARYLEVDDGVYVQVEFLALSRSVPAIFAWLVNPYVKSVPREYLTNYIAQLNKAVKAESARTEGTAAPKE